MHYRHLYQDLMDCTDASFVVTGHIFNSVFKNRNSVKAAGGYLTFIHCTILSSPQAFSAFYFTHKYISTLTNMDMTSPNQTAKAVRHVCNMSISEVLSIKTLRRVDL